MERFRLCSFGAGQPCSSLSCLGLLSALDAERAKPSSPGGCPGAVQEQHRGTNQASVTGGLNPMNFAFAVLNINQGKDGLRRFPNSAKDTRV